MVNNGEVAIFGQGPAGVSCAKNLLERGLKVTAFRPLVNRASRSVYTTSIEAAETLQYDPDSVRELSLFRVITTYGVDVRMKTPGSYFMVDNQAFIDQAAILLQGSGLEPIKLPKKTLKQIGIKEFRDKVEVQIDGAEKSFDFVVDCTGVDAEIVTKLDPTRLQKDFLAEYVYGGAFRGSMDQDELAIVVGPAGGTSWVCPSVIPGLIDVVFSAWGPASMFKSSFLPSARLRLQILKHFLANKPGINIESQKAEEIYCGMIRSHPTPKTSFNRIFAVGEAAGMARPMTGDSIRFALKGGELLAQAIDKGINASSFQKSWQRDWNCDLFLAWALTRLPNQQNGELGKRERFLNQALDQNPNLVKDAEDLIIRGITHPRLIWTLIQDPTIGLFLSNLLLKRAEIWFKGNDNIGIPWTLPEVD